MFQSFYFIVLDRSLVESLSNLFRNDRMEILIGKPRYRMRCDSHQCRIKSYRTDGRIRTMIAAGFVDRQGLQFTDLVPCAEVDGLLYRRRVADAEVFVVAQREYRDQDACKF